MPGPNVAVVGAGAVGCYYGGMLARAGTNVTLIGRSRHVEAINRNGLLFKSGDVEERISIAATTDMAVVGSAQLVLFCVKSLDTDEAARAMAPHLAPAAVVLSLQNGVDNVERIRSHVKNQVMPVIVYTAAQMPAAGRLEHTGGGNLVIGQMNDVRTNDESERRLLEEIAALFTAAGVPTKISETIEVELWVKLVLNCAYNAISALTGSLYGRFIAMPEIRRIMTDVVDEIVQVAQAKGIRLPDNIVETTMKLAEVLPRTRSSTAQDIMKGKPTEIDHLNGYVARQGEALEIPTPVNRTLAALTKLLEQTKLDSSG